LWMSSVPSSVYKPSSSTKSSFKEISSIVAQKISYFLASSCSLHYQQISNQISRKHKQNMKIAQVVL
jgi:hypothetical protein